VCFHRRGGGDRDDLQAEIRGGLLEITGGRVLDDERAAVELLPRGIEWFFRRFERRVLELVAQRDQRDVGVVVDENTGPVLETPPLARTAAVIFSTGASSTLMSATRTACTLKSSGNVQPVSSYGVFCGSLGLQYW
jgi:hypothetical protein